jgi:enolase-phosphatase E1
MTRGILLDIEGTTTPITFVYDVLFPFARAHAGEYLDQEAEHSLKVEHDADIRQGLSPPPWSSGALEYVCWLMDQDRKSTALKTLQGKIWQQGYRLGELRGEVFPDVPPAFERWSQAGRDIRIYSSGSVLAQQLLFSTTRHGDLTRFLTGYFDTTTGPKADAASYRAIASTFGLPADEILFVSDVTRELDAASTAGMQVLLSLRPGNPSQPPNAYPSITSFDQIEIRGQTTRTPKLQP